MQEIKATPE